MGRKKKKRVGKCNQPLNITKKHQNGSHDIGPDVDLEESVKYIGDLDPDDLDLVWFDDADELDGRLKAKSESAYIEISKTIVDSAVKQLVVQNVSKNSLKKIFTIFFVVFLSVQYAVLAALLFIRTFQCYSLLSDAVIISYITSVFVETLGAVILMIRYAFDAAQETKVLEILNSIISSFQILRDKK